jgi:hypothetical protein
MANSAPKIDSLAVGFLTALLVYYEFYRWIPLGAWNGEFRWPVHNDQFYPDIAIGLLLLWMVVSFRRQRKVSMWIGVALLMLWCGVHLNDWWIPYLKGTRAERDGFYRFYASRSQLLPVIGRHRPPDAGHTVLDFFVFAALLLSLASGVRHARARRKSVLSRPYPAL